MQFVFTGIANEKANDGFDDMCRVFEPVLRERFESSDYGESVEMFAASVRILSDEYIRRNQPKEGIERYSPKEKLLFVERSVDYNAFVNASKEGRVRLVADCILRIVRDSDSMRRKPKDFDKEGLLRDIEVLVRERGWVE